MIVGDKERFGIEFELDAAKLANPKLTEWEYGRIRWWCGGEEVGRYEADTTLRDVSVEAARFLANEGKRRDEGLMGASSEEIVRILVEALYEDHGQSDEQVEADDERYQRFVVKPQVDVFDPWDIFLIEGEKNARLIWRQVKDAGVHERELASGEFDAVLRRFLAALGDAAGKSLPS
ncbi:MAG TPA: Imm42 family immunity protein [Polyangiaceae bacterium]|nr:Imm42 family immunity protein [Polyangiaceae bacterium]